MSNLLNEAIVDAKALREAALKNAETVVIEKYSEEVRDTLNKLLEQEDELGLDMGDEAGLDAAAPDLGADPLAEVEEEEEAELTEDEIPFSATDDLAGMEGKNLKSFSKEGENVELSINLGALQEAVAALATELDEDEEIDLSEFLNEEEDEVDEALSPAIAAAMKAKGMSTDGAKTAAPAAPGSDQKMADFKQKKIASLEQELKALGGSDPAKAKSIMKMIMALKAKREGMAEDQNHESIHMDSLVDEIMEKLTVDMGADLAGWAGRRHEDKTYQIEKEMAHRASTDVAEELNNLKKAHEEMVFENNQLAEHNNQYKQALQELKENLQDVNLSNARLLYTNRILRNPSLNERQKNKIVEAISGAGSVTEAKTIFETLQSTVESAPKKSPKSLSEAIGRRTSVLRATRKEAPSSDPVTDRMKILAGIK